MGSRRPIAARVRPNPRRDRSIAPRRRVTASQTHLDIDGAEGRRLPRRRNTLISRWIDVKSTRIDPKRPSPDRLGHATRPRAVYGIRTQLGSTDPSPRSMCPMLAIVPPQAEVGPRVGRDPSTSRSRSVDTSVAIGPRLGCNRPTSSRSRSMFDRRQPIPRPVSVKRPAPCGPSSASLRIERIGERIGVTASVLGSFAGARGTLGGHGTTTIIATARVRRNVTSL
jgi:hypothetical protein